MSLELSLYHLAEGGDLLELFEIRAEMKSELRAVEASDPEVAEVGRENIRVIDEQITAYMAALPTKVDSVRHVWKRIEVLIQEAADEVKFQSRRGQHLKADLERLKDYCQRCMELIEWKPGKPRKLEGRSGYLLLKGNGGRPAVEVYDESLMPDDLCTVTVTMPMDVWKNLCGSAAPALKLLEAAAPQLKLSPRVPSLSLISARLSEACKGRGCDQGKILNPEQDLNAPIDENTVINCPECGGSGKQSVPGARMKPVGQHVEVK